MSDDMSDRIVGQDGKCVMTGHPCTCVPKTAGHWCCWSYPSYPKTEPATDPPAATAPAVKP